MLGKMSSLTQIVELLREEKVKVLAALGFATVLT